MVQFNIMSQASYVLKIQNRLDLELPYDISQVDPTIQPGVVPPSSQIELVLNISSVPVIAACVKLLTLPYSYGRPVYVAFSQKTDSPPNIQDIDLTEIPGFIVVENNDAVDHIMESGHNVKLSGGNTNNIFIEVWYDAQLS